MSIATAGLPIKWLNPALEAELKEDIATKWTCNDLKTALANSPHPLNHAIGVIYSGHNKTIALLEENNVDLFISNHRVPADYVFVVWDGAWFKIGKKADFLKDRTGDNPILDALKVMVLDSNHRAWLQDNDLKALQQAVLAIQGVEREFVLPDTK